MPPADRFPRSRAGAAGGAAETRRRTPPRVWIAACLAGILAASGCAGRYAGPRTLAALGGTMAVAGGGSWAAGERLGRDSLVPVGFGAVAAGIAAIIASGAWMSASIACRADADCDETEACKEVPAPPGGVPYSQCVNR